MRIALDATYSIDPHPSGIAVYSSELLRGLAEQHPGDQFIHCYRWKQWSRSRPRSQPAPNIERALLLPPIPTFHAEVFHALNQRVDRRPARHVAATFHDLFVLTAEYSSSDFRARFQQQAEHAARRADLILAVSQFTAAQVEALLAVPASRIRVVPHGISLPSEQPVPTGARENIILFVGALQRRKNVKRLVQAFASLPRDWRLVLAGSPSGYGAAEVLTAVEESTARSRIQLTGYLPRPELLRLYRRSAIFAFPSLDEGFGMPVLEAMSYGLPVLTSNRSAMPEVAGNAALLVEPESEEAIAAGLRHLAGDPTLRGQLALEGLLRAQSFSWRQTCEKTYSAYQELTS